MQDLGLTISAFVQRVQRKIAFMARHHGPVFMPRGLVRTIRMDARPVRRIALIIKGKTAHPATAHIRVLRTFRALAKRMPVDARPVTLPWLLDDGGLAAVDAVLVQRDALAPESTDALIDALARHGVPLLYEIDDWLWNLPDDHRDHAITDAHKVSMKKLAAAAALVTVSTDKLGEILREYNRNVAVIPNGLDETIWADPLPAAYVRHIGQVNGLGVQRQRLLYMGTKSHAADVEMISDAVAQIRVRYPDLDIVQVGGGLLLPGARELVPPPGEYPDFVRWFRAVCAYATLAVAPLRDDEFNSAKSDIKTLDYGFGRVPAVFSNAGPYRETVADGVTGLLCDNDTAAWCDAMHRMLGDAGLRTGITDRAFAAADARGLRKDVAVRWESVLAPLFGAAPAAAPAPSFARQKR